MNNADDKQRRLGRGLGALLPPRPLTPPLTVAGNAVPVVVPEKPTRLPVSEIHRNPDQPRTYFDEDKLKELALSIQEVGVIQPIIVTKAEEGYRIVAGERRWRAAQIAGLAEVPVVVQDQMADRNLLEVALIENIQREDLNPIECATALDRLCNFGFSQEEVGRRTGKERTTVANMIRLLRLPAPVQALVASGTLSMGHAKALLSLHAPDDQTTLAEVIVTKGFSVRQAELQAQIILGDKEKPQRTLPLVDPNVKAAVEELERVLGTRVKIVAGNGERGRIEIEYYSQAELDRLYGMLTS
jgi:ParB family transcriptional regulator, chromosome partitioning protein